MIIQKSSTTIPKMPGKLTIPNDLSVLVVNGGQVDRWLSSHGEAKNFKIDQVMKHVPSTVTALVPEF